MVDVTHQAIAKAVKDARTAIHNNTVEAEGKTFAKVCSVCDRLIKTGKEQRITLEFLKKEDIQNRFSKQRCTENSNIDIPYTCIEYYTLSCYPLEQTEFQFLKHLVLSPRSYKSTWKGKPCLGVCCDCYTTLRNIAGKPDKKGPLHAIFNGLTIGNAPPELQKLNDVELAMLNPAGIDKHVFSFEAGSHKTMKGWHSQFYNDLETTNEVVNWCNQADQNSENGKANIAVILSGPFTERQRATVLERTQVRWGFIREAIQWLNQNNRFFIESPLDPEKVKEPIVIDNHVLVSSSNQNVEESIEMLAVFPDGDEPKVYNGGMETQEEFTHETLLRKAGMSGARSTIICRPTRKRVDKDYLGENMIKSFILQFPYGIGYANMDTDKDRSGLAYFRYLASMSNPVFHRASFMCVLHNLAERKRMVSNAYIQVRSGMAKEFAHISDKDIQKAINDMSKGQMKNNTAPADLFLKKVKTITQAMGHTNQAATKARQQMFAMLTRFGLPALMFTVTPDDEFSYSIKVLAAGEKGCQPPPIKGRASQDEMSGYAKECSMQRVKYPGLCAWNFMNLLDVVVEHLLGWDTKKKRPLKGKGIFGELDGWSYAVEEQGRKTLHAHFLVFVKGWGKLMSNIHHPRTQEASVSQLLKYVDMVSSSKVHGTEVKCACGSIDIEPCSEQDLRNLRHKKGKTSFGERAIRRCIACKKTESSDELAVRRAIEKDLITPDCSSILHKTDTGHIQLQMFVMNQMMPGRDSQDPRTMFAINLLYNLHKEKHARSCFKKGEECRARVPNRACEETKLHFGTKTVSWYDHKGQDVGRNLFSCETKRAHCDAFANIYNPHASLVLGCNTNVVVGVDGGVVYYCTLYSSKGTQSDDSAAFGRACSIMIRNMQARLNPIDPPDENEQEENESGLVDDEEKAVMNALIGSVFIATSSNICSATMASHLIRAGSRFGFSHEFGFVYLRNYVQKEETLTIDIQEGGKISRKSAMDNYLFRPKELRDTSLYEFYANFITGNFRKGTDRFSWKPGHPQAKKVSLREAICPRIPLVAFWEIPSVWDTINNPEERNKRERTISALFHPIESLEDIENRNTESTPVSPFCQSILDNCQECHNSTCTGSPKDPLESVTRIFQNIGNRCALEEEEVEIEGRSYEMDDILNNLELLSTKNLTTRNKSGIFMIDSSIIRKDGKRQCGFNMLKRSPHQETESVLQFSTFEQSSGPNVITPDIQGQPCESLHKLHLYELLVERQHRVVDQSQECESWEANGTPEDIKHYARVRFSKYTWDPDQAQSFQVICSSYVLQLFKVAQRNDPEPMSNQTKQSVINNVIEGLLEMCGKQSQLICFMSGAGGTGKSEVIKGVVHYAKCVHESLGLEFNRRSLVVSAITGAAATSINGETTAMSCALNRTIKEEDVAQFKDTHMIIVDEISFAGQKVLEVLNEKLRELKAEPGYLYGGIPIVFAGDFGQLPPVGDLPLYLFPESPLFGACINVYLELRTNHRFRDDPEWGLLLARFREDGPTEADVELINKRVLNNTNGYRQIPEDTVYVTTDNKDRSAINDGLFVDKLKRFCSKDPEKEPPTHMVCIKACNVRYRKAQTRQTYVELNTFAQDVLFAYCGEGHMSVPNNGMRADPFLKLYRGRPIMITQNIDVESSLANGAMGTFEGIRLEPGVGMDQMEKVCIDGYYVWCVSAEHVAEILVRMNSGTNCSVVGIEKSSHSLLVNFPSPWMASVSQGLHRRPKRMTLKQFPIVAADARTCHKLQGRSLKNTLISSWDYTKNWVYVALSRAQTREGLFLRIPLEFKKCRSISEELKTFTALMRSRCIPDIS